MRRIGVLCLVVASIAWSAPQEADLFDAADRGDVARLRALIEQGADVHSTDSHHRSALHHAAANCRVQAVQLLVLHGSDLVARDDEGRTPAAVQKNCKEGNYDGLVISVLLTPPRISAKPGEVPWSLHYAASHGQAGVVSMLLKMRADANATNAEGDRPLDLACLKGDAATTKILLEGGAIPTLRSKSGSTPLHNAAASGNREVVELLLQHGADPNAAESEGRATPLHYASSFGRLEAVKALVQHGADLSLRNAKGQTALDLAIENNQKEVAEFLRGALARPRQ